MRHIRNQLRLKPLALHPLVYFPLYPLPNIVEIFPMRLKVKKHILCVYAALHLPRRQTLSRPLQPRHLQQAFYKDCI